MQVFFLFFWAGLASPRKPFLSKFDRAISRLLIATQTPPQGSEVAYQFFPASARLEGTTDSS
jgi:hypothetical protein